MKKIGLFCYLGDKIYWFQHLKHGRAIISPMIRESVVTEIQIMKSGIYYHCDSGQTRHTFSNRGFKDNWFLDRDEAKEYVDRIWEGETK